MNPSSHVGILDNEPTHDLAIGKATKKTSLTQGVLCHTSDYPGL